MTLQYLKRGLLYFLMLIPIASIGQNKLPTCEKLKSGTFYLYPSDVNKRYQAIRKGNIQIERDLDTGDTAVLKIEWPSECKYTLQYLSGTRERSRAEEEFWASHKITFEIVKVGKDYYVFKGYVENEPDMPTLQDTIWLKLPAYKTTFPSTYNPPASKHGKPFSSPPYPTGNWQQATGNSNLSCLFKFESARTTLYCLNSKLPSAIPCVLCSRKLKNVALS